MKLQVNIKVKEIRNSDASPSDLKLVGKASAKRTVPLFAQGVAYPVHFTTLNNYHMKVFCISIPVGFCRSELSV